MTFLAVTFPYILSLVIGYLSVDLLTRRNAHSDRAVNFFFGVGVGLGISAFLTFASFIILDCFSRTFVLVAHALILAGLIYLNKRFPRQKEKTAETTPPLVIYQTIGLHTILLLATLTLCFFYKAYPFGGWDAWQVWNFKAKLLFLGGTHWRDIFLPSLWQTSPHYPLLLPLINVWAWVFQSEPLRVTPFLTSFVSSYATMGLLFSALFWLTKRSEMILAPLLLLSLPGFGTLATSQYSDILVGYYILAAIVGFIVVRNKKIREFALPTGLCAGFLAFSKPEGGIAAIFIAGLGIVHLIAAKGQGWKNRDTRRIIGLFLAGFLPALIPSVIFHSILSPENQTFINGFLNHDHPTTLARIKAIFTFILFYFLSKDMRLFWVLLFVGLLTANRRAIKGKEIIPSFLLLYLSTVIVYYAMNTYFEIVWWLKVTVFRIYFTLLPLSVFWIFYSLGQKEKGDSAHE